MYIVQRTKTLTHIAKPANQLNSTLNFMVWNVLFAVLFDYSVLPFFCTSLPVKFYFFFYLTTNQCLNLEIVSFGFGFGFVLFYFVIVVGMLLLFLNVYNIFCRRFTVKFNQIE